MPGIDQVSVRRGLAPGRVEPGPVQQGGQQWMQGAVRGQRSAGAARRGHRPASIAARLLHRTRLDAARRQAAADGHLIDPWHLAATLEGLPLRASGTVSG